MRHAFSLAVLLAAGLLTAGEEPRRGPGGARPRPPGEEPGKGPGGAPAPDPAPPTPPAEAPKGDGGAKGEPVAGAPETAPGLYRGDIALRNGRTVMGLIRGRYDPKEKKTVPVYEERKVEGDIELFVEVPRQIVKDTGGTIQFERQIGGLRVFYTYAMDGFAYLPAGDIDSFAFGSEVTQADLQKHYLSTVEAEAARLQKENEEIRQKAADWVKQKESERATTTQRQGTEAEEATSRQRRELLQKYPAEQGWGIEKYNFLLLQWTLNRTLSPQEQKFIFDDWKPWKEAYDAEEAYQKALKDREEGAKPKPEEKKEEKKPEGKKTPEEKKTEAKKAEGSTPPAAAA